MVELRELHYFRTVVECGSFSKAAVKLRIAQPSLSRQVRSLEHELGLSLLHRTLRGVTPTEAGRALLERTLQLEQNLDDIRRSLVAMAGGVRGTLRVAVQSPVSCLLLPNLVKHYRARYPEVEMQLVEGFSGDVIEWLLAGLIDVAIVDMPGTASTDLNTTPLWVERFSLFGSVDAPAVQPGRAEISLAEVSKLPLIAASKRHAVRHLVDTAFERRALSFQPILEANGALMIFELVRGGLGYTLMPESALYPFRAFGALRSIAVKPEIYRTISITVRATVVKDRAINAFRDLVIDSLPELAGSMQLGSIELYPPQSPPT